MDLLAIEKEDSKIELSDLFHAYFECRKNKRNKINSLAFELNYESNLIGLYNEINDGTYQPGRSIAFIVDKPVKREVFAADFRDRVVHHLVIQKLNPYFEKLFIFDSYSCRIGKGTHFGIQRVNHFIRQCSQNYQKDCYILKLDIEGFFMHIDKDILYPMLHSFIDKQYHDGDKPIILELSRKIIYNEPTINCIIKGKKSNWDGLPPSKSLFHANHNCGLPIGNLTSQIFANFYLDTLDQYIKQELKINYYGRYVDDFIIIHSDREYLLKLISNIKEFLASNLKLALHPKKIYLQHYCKGVKFLGTIIKPHRIYIASRTKGNFHQSIASWNKIIRAKNKLTKEEQSGFLSCMNSYLGIMKHYKTYKLRKKMLKENVSAYFWNYFYVGKNKTKLERKIKIIRGSNSEFLLKKYIA